MDSSLGRLKLTSTEPNLFTETKACARCREEKSIDEFTRQASRRDGLNPYCRDCTSYYSKSYYEANKAKAYERTSAYARANPEKNRAKSAAWRSKNPEKVKARKKAEYAANREEITALLRDANFKRKFGISLEERDAMAESQGRRCAICQKHEDELDKRLAVDHDHATGAVRELLCQPCNLALGLMRENTLLLSSAIYYLKRHGKSAGRIIDDEL